jgi:hypothetical protein
MQASVMKKYSIKYVRKDWLFNMNSESSKLQQELNKTLEENRRLKAILKQIIDICNENDEIIGNGY